MTTADIYSHGDPRIGTTDVDTYRAVPHPDNTNGDRLGTWCVVAGDGEEADVWVEVTAEYPQDVAEYIVQAVRNEHASQPRVLTNGRMRIEPQTTRALNTGNLRDVMADAILTATYPPEEWPDGPPGEGEMDTAREQADAALAVRWTLAAHVVGRLAQAEQRAEYAEGAAQVNSERASQFRRERDDARREAERLRTALTATEQHIPATTTNPSDVPRPSPASAGSATRPPPCAARSWPISSMKSTRPSA